MHRYTRDNKTEFPNEVNILERFNIYQEFFLGVIYKIIKPKLIPIIWYSYQGTVILPETCVIQIHVQFSIFKWSTVFLCTLQHGCYPVRGWQRCLLRFSSLSRGSIWQEWNSLFLFESRLLFLFGRCSLLFWPNISNQVLLMMWNTQLDFASVSYN